MQDTFARATHSAYAAGRQSAARDDRVSCMQINVLCDILWLAYAKTPCQVRVRHKAHCVNKYMLLIIFSSQLY